ncbi:DUF1376 domain-containing protein [Methylobacterium sp. J-092]|uniref:DUF1376 domain-containing protein n=1 Tax=Methylobacterium sp. J-092 TaxID=2836667 RepID=UPI001FB8CE06|nr:DUF1376 domain-containing protein [Methylobacterium sp. J-092]MCJ2009787.1 YdaU family protein [Methylobacterium sp. J-092]
MKGEFYKMDYEAWDEGTDELSLEQEAAYLRLCHQLYRRKASIPSAPATLGRIWRCHPNKARKLLGDLIAAGKIVEKDGLLSNTRVTRELDDRETRRTQQADAGHIGGTRSQENRRKPLKINGGDRADASSAAKRNQAEEEREGEKKEQIEALPPSDVRESDGFPSNAFDLFWAEYPEKVGKDPARKSFATVRKSRRVTFAALMDGLARYQASKPADRNWCHPTTWLNQGRWSDQPAAPMQRPVAVRGSPPRASTADLWAGDAFDAHESRQRGPDEHLPFPDSRAGGETAGDPRWDPASWEADRSRGRLPAQQPRDDPRQLPPLRLVGRA